MSVQETWYNLEGGETSGEARSSQETIGYNHDNIDYEISESQHTTMLFPTNGLAAEEVAISSSQNGVVVKQIPENLQGSIITERFPQTSASFMNIEPAVFINEDALMYCESSPAFGSPHDITSPGGGGDSSPFETMESDGLVDPDESIFSASGQSARRSFPNAWHGAALSTTTPGGSSDEDPYASSGSRKKRRRIRKESSRYYVNEQSFQHTSPHSQIPSPVPSTEIQGNETEDAATSHYNALRRNSCGVVNNSDSNLFATIRNANRRPSNASESSQNTSVIRENVTNPTDSTVITSISNLPSGESSTVTTSEQSKKTVSSRRRLLHHHRSAAPASAQSLHTPHPSSFSGCSLHILTQPESQHRARYLTEGSRGPVKDATQQGYPQLQLKGYTGKTTLHVYVGAESDDKIRPHGFYQACKVTGRNTSPCEEVEVEGTKVIHIPFDPQENISVDCVGILKLRNADVEARIGLARSKKRSQTVRLVFRVILEEMPSSNGSEPCILQVVSNRINCTQPPGQSEIIKKSLERCPVEGGSEMFIIGRNFHKGIKVIFQDSEEPDGSHWHKQAQIDKDTFNSSHMVVHVPPYHDQNIVKPVNVQLFVEHNGRKCDPHSFTYDPNTKISAKGVREVEDQEKETEKTKDSDETYKAFLEGRFDRKLLEALFAKLLRPSDGENGDANFTSKVPLDALITSTQLPALPPSLQRPTQTNQIQQLPVLFASGENSLPTTVQRPVPMQSPAFSLSSGVIRPNVFGGNIVSSTALRPGIAPSSVQAPLTMTLQNSTGIQCSTIPGTSSTSASLQGNCQQMPIFATLTSHVAAAPSQTTNTMVKSESETKFVWPSQSSSFPNVEGAQKSNVTGLFSISQTPNVGGNVVFSLQGNNITGANSSQPTLSIVQQPFHLNQCTDEAMQVVTNNIRPPQASTPVQELQTENSVTFAATQQDIWPSQVVRAAPNLLQDNTILRATNVPVSMNVITAAQTMSNQPTGMETVTFQSGAFSQHSAGSVKMPQVSQNAWPSSQQMVNDNATLFSQSNHSLPVTAVQTTATPFLWQSSGQPMNQTGQVGIISNAMMPGSSHVQLQPSDTGAAFVFNRTMADHDTIVVSSQQQLFTLPANVQIIDSKTSTSNPSPGKQQETNLSSHLLLITGNDATAEGTTTQSGETLNSPLLNSSTGLSVGFDNNFSIHDGEILMSPKALEHSVLQTIISDCTNSTSSFGIDESACTGQVDHIFQQQLPVNSQEIPDHVGMEHGTTQTITLGSDQGTVPNPPVDVVQPSLQFVTGSEIGIIEVPQERTEHLGQQSQTLQAAQVPVPQQDILKHSDIDDLLNDAVNPVVDTNIYLVNPNSVQPMIQQQEIIVDMSSSNATSNVVYAVGSSEMSSTNHQQNHQAAEEQHVEHLQHVTQSCILSTGNMSNNFKSELTTIDGSALELTHADQGNLVQTLNSFSQTSTPANN